MTKAQAGLDYLMTYGWALLIIVLVIAMLFAMGIFDVGSFLGNRSAGFGDVRPIAWRIDNSGNFTLKLQNNAGVSVNVTNITASLGIISISTNNTTSVFLPSGQQSGTIVVGNFSNVTTPVGSLYSMRLSIQYVDMGTNFTYTNSGTLTGRVG